MAASKIVPAQSVIPRPKKKKKKGAVSQRSVQSEREGQTETDESTATTPGTTMASQRTARSQQITTTRGKTMASQRSTQGAMSTQAGTQSVIPGPKPKQAWSPAPSGGRAEKHWTDHSAFAMLTALWTTLTLVALFAVVITVLLKGKKEVVQKKHPARPPLTKGVPFTGSVTTEEYVPMLPNITELCLREYGTCFYYNRKFVDSCIEVPCDSIHTFFDVNTTADGNSHLVFYAPRPQQKVKVPNETACNVSGVVGMCFGTTCSAAANQDPRFQRHVNLKPLAGRYKFKRAGYFTRCMEVKQEVLEKFPVNKTMNCRTEKGETCLGYTIAAYTCSPPLPQYDANLCIEYTRTESGKPVEFLTYPLYPITFDHKCANCQFDDNRVIKIRQECRKDPTKYPCQWNDKSMMLSEPCCMPNITNRPRTDNAMSGLCAFGTCFIVIPLLIV